MCAPVNHHFLLTHDLMEGFIPECVVQAWSSLMVPTRISLFLNEVSRVFHSSMNRVSAICCGTSILNAPIPSCMLISKSLNFSYGNLLTEGWRPFFVKSCKTLWQRTLLSARSPLLAATYKFSCLTLRVTHVRISACKWGKNSKALKHMLQLPGFYRKQQIDHVGSTTNPCTHLRDDLFQ